uniref:ZM domain-containing protein n=1 Tax=Globodera pallida TaxID=36090 RepID=A0A183CDD6_GLOPA
MQIPSRQGQGTPGLGRPTGGGAGAGGSTSGYRHYHAARPVDGWAAHTAALGGADSAPRLMVDSTSTRHTHIGTPQHGGVGTSTTAPLLHQQQQQYAALRDTSPQHETPTTSPTSIAPHGTGKAAANGQLKRLDPVKLVVEEMPYMDNEQE